MQARNERIPMSVETEITWQPTEDYLEQSRLLAFARANGVEGYRGLCEWAADDPGAYWDAFVARYWIAFRSTLCRARRFLPGQGMAGVVSGSWIRLCQHYLRAGRRTRNALDELAVIWEGDGGDTRSLTYDQLWREIRRFANALEKSRYRQGRSHRYLPADGPGNGCRGAVPVA